MEHTKQVEILKSADAAAPDEGKYRCWRPVSPSRPRPMFVLTGYKEEKFLKTTLNSLVYLKVYRKGSYLALDDFGVPSRDEGQGCGN